MRGEIIETVHVVVEGDNKEEGFYLVNLREGQIHFEADSRGGTANRYSTTTGKSYV